MKMGRRTANSIGLIGAVAIVSIAYFGVINPIMSETKKVQSELANAQAISQSQTAKLNNFTSGGNKETQDATALFEEFSRLVSPTMDIESASRAIASALPSGVRLQSFNFGAPAPVSGLSQVDLATSGFVSPSEFSTDAAAAPNPNENKQNQQEAAIEESGGELNSENLAEGPSTANPNAAGSGFQQVPFTVEVVADSYNDLAVYLDSLAQQPRLMSVVSVNASRADAVTATVYVFAFMNS